MKALFLILFCLISFPISSQDTYLELNLNDSRNVNIFARQNSMLDVFRIIEKASTDNKIKGIFLNIGSINRSRDSLWELRTALEQFKASGKNICAFISYADMDTYALASVADKIVMDEMGTLSIMGYASSGLYTQRALERLGIGVRELRYFEYKSAVEMFVRDSMSDADRRQNNDYLDDIFNFTRNTLINARNWSSEEFDTILNQEYLYSARNALSRNLVDYIGRKGAVLEAINAIEGIQIRNFVLFGDSGSSLTDTSINYTLPNAGGLFSRNPIIAVVYANGQTDMENGISALSLSRTIRQLAENNRIQAIVIRINSPGGSAEAADYLDEAVRYAKLRKPVVISMGQVAASGGYWAAMSANHIVANPYTITGSIGVISNWFYDNGLNNTLGISLDVLQRGSHADLAAGFLFAYRDLTVQEIDRYRILLQDLYSTFVHKVASGRSMDIDSVEAISQGRIFSGIRAYEAGLVDSIGSLADALRIARKLAEIPEGRIVRYDEYPKQTFMDRFFGNVPFMFRIFKSRTHTNTTDILTDMLLPEDLRYRLEHNGKIMALLPLEFSVR